MVTYINFNLHPVCRAKLYKLQHGKDIVFADLKPPAPDLENPGSQFWARCMYFRWLSKSVTSCLCIRVWERDMWRAVGEEVDRRRGDVGSYGEGN